MTMRAIYEDGVFKPITPVDIPNKAEVELEATIVTPVSQEPQAGAERARNEIFEILSRRYRTGQTDTAARHDEHQP